MHRIKLIEPAWSGFTGMLGVVEFEDGVSVEPVTDRVADLIAVSMQVETYNEDGSPGEGVGPQYRLGPGLKRDAEVLDPLTRGNAEPEEGTDQDTPLDDPDAKVVAVEGVKFFTSAELEAIADEKGIHGLRDIGTPLGARARAIPDLITAILEAQEKIVRDRLPLNERVPDAMKPADEGAEADTKTDEPAADQAVKNDGGETSDPAPEA